MIGAAGPLCGQVPEPQIERSVLLTWPASEPSYIVVQSDSPEGPWKPTLEPIAQALGEDRVAAPIRGDAQFFRLAEGGQFLEDFSSGTPWAPYYLDPADEGRYTFSYDNGVLRIQQSELGYAAKAVTLMPPGMPYGDNCSMCMDILDWDAEANDQLISFVARFSFDPNDLGGYWPRFRINNSGSSAAYLYMYSPSEPTPGEDWADLSQKRPLRLVYSIVGNQHTFALYDLADLENPIASIEPVTHVHDRGLLGVWLSDLQTPDPFDVTIDNIVMTWTTRQ